ncbi:MAG: PxKF domain-containing protein, partial [Candidatus Omnitrophica bacterium]|nr:PxKF domain-containing protein [Candidatus Omnitrophota bacterium]
LWLNILKNDECWINTDVCTSKRSQCIANNCGLFNETNNPLCDECRDPVLFHRPFYIECGSGQCNACDQFPTGWAVSCQEATGPLDPNEKHVLADTYIQPDQPLVYPIHYENIGEVEAVDVFITDVLDPALDDSTLEFLVPEDASYDPATRQITWSLLDRNLQPGESDSVLFSIQPLPDLPSGTEIPNDAEIQFEVFDPLVTNTVLNVIDTDPPSCVVDRLPAEIPSTEFTLSWTGEDAVGEIKNYSIFVSVDNVDFEPFLLEVPGTTYVFEGEIGKSYGFFCVAIDTANNVELQELTAEATTTLIEDAELFEFNGFFWPVKSLPAQNTITAGRVVPMRWQLKNASGDFVQDLEAVKSVQYQADNCDGSVDEAGELVDAKSIGNLNVFFTRRTNTYTYLWKTPNNLKGECVDFVLTLGDERSYKARFKFRRQHRGPHFKD